MPKPLSATRRIAAPPGEVYAVLADYHNGHPGILPRPPFVGLQVEAGGVGTGTVITVTMQVLGRRQSFRATITEPEPGRVLEETAETGYVTRFLVDPREGGRQSEVTIQTRFPARSGLAARLERWMVRRMLAPAYHRELELLARAVEVSLP